MLGRASFPFVDQRVCFYHEVVAIATARLKEGIVAVGDSVVFGGGCEQARLCKSHCCWREIRTRSFSTPGEGGRAMIWPARLLASENKMVGKGEAGG